MVHPAPGILSFLRTRLARLSPLALLVGLAACTGESTPPVTAGDVVFTADQLLGLPTDRRVLLAEIAVFGTAVADSASARLGAPWIEARITERLWQRVRAEAALDSAGVGDDVLEARYRFAPELELTVRHLLVFSARYEAPSVRAAARKKAEAALARIRAGEPFQAVAADVSEEPGAASREGLLTPGREGAWVDEFWTAASALDPGEVSPVVETRYGFHVLRLEARDTVPFAEARPRVVLEVAELMGLRTDGLAGVELPTSRPDPPGPDRLGDPSVSDTTLIADGVGWSIDLGDVRDAVALMPYDRWRRRATDPTVVREATTMAVRRAVADALAAAAGIEPTATDRASVEGEFTDQAERWATQLGFRPGLGPEAVGRAALRALADGAQNAALARATLQERWGGLIHRWRPIHVEETPAPSGA